MASGKKVFVKLLSGRVLELEISDFISCEEFYHIVYHNLPEETRPDECCGCTMNLFFEDRFIPFEYDELLDAIEGQVFLLLVDCTRYTSTMTRDSYGRDTEGNTYDTAVVTILENGVVYHSDLLSLDSETASDFRILKKESVISEYRLFPGHRDEMYYTKKEFVELLLNRAGIRSIGARECLRYVILDQMNQFIEMRI